LRGIREESPQRTRFPTHLQICTNGHIQPKVSSKSTHNACNWHPLTCQDNADHVCVIMKCDRTHKQVSFKSQMNVRMVYLLYRRFMTSLRHLFRNIWLHFIMNLQYSEKAKSSNPSIQRRYSTIRALASSVEVP
jgi:hypothetical protein